MPNPVDFADFPVALQGVPSPGYNAIDLRRYVSSIYSEGTAGSPDALRVGAPGGMNLSVAPGKGYVEGDSIGDQGLYYARLGSAVSDLTVGASDATNPRIDQVVLELKDHQHDGGGLTKARARVVPGAATSGATLANRLGAAALPSSALRLADVLVPALANAIAAANIADRRVAAGAGGSRKSGPQAAIGSYTFTGLNGDAERRYELWLGGRLFGGGAARTVTLRPNGSTTGMETTYTQQGDGAAPGGALNPTQLLLGGSYSALDTDLIVKASLACVTGRQRPMTYQMFGKGVASGRYTQNGGGVWTDTTTNITSLVVDFGGGTFTGDLELR